jgi:hypothetical protein
LPGVHDVEREDLSDNLVENNNMSQEYPTGQEDGMQWCAAVFRPTAINADSDTLE